MSPSQESDCTWNSLVCVAFWEMELFSSLNLNWECVWLAQLRTTLHIRVQFKRRRERGKLWEKSGDRWPTRYPLQEIIHVQICARNPDTVDGGSCMNICMWVCLCLCVIKRHDHLGRCWRSFHIALPPWTRCAAVVVGVCGSLVVITLPSKRRGVSVDVKRSRAGHFR